MAGSDGVKGPGGQQVGLRQTTQTTKNQGPQKLFGGFEKMEKEGKSIGLAPQQSAQIAGGKTIGIPPSEMDIEDAQEVAANAARLISGFTEKKPDGSISVDLSAEAISGSIIRRFGFDDVGQADAAQSILESMNTIGDKPKFEQAEQDRRNLDGLRQVAARQSSIDETANLQKASDMGAVLKKFLEDKPDAAETSAASIGLGGKTAEDEQFFAQNCAYVASMRGGGLDVIPRLFYNAQQICAQKDDKFQKNMQTTVAAAQANTRATVIGGPGQGGAAPVGANSPNPNKGPVGPF